MTNDHKDAHTKRAIELDFLRGIAVLLMAFHHVIFDLRHIFGLDILAFQDTVWFMDWFRPIILVLFLTVSGISSSFSRSNWRRGLKMASLAIGITIALEIVSRLMNISYHIYFNVFHLLAVGILLYALIAGESFARKKDLIDKEINRVDYKALFLIVSGLIILFLGASVEKTNPISHNYLFVFGLYSQSLPMMADYLPIIPWLGMFLIGAAIGRIFYPQRRSLLTGIQEESLGRLGKPIIFLGKHALVFYILHQPIILTILYLVLKVVRR